MNNMIWLLRAAKWARRPPSPRTAKLVLVVMGTALASVALESLGMWPE